MTPIPDLTPQEFREITARMTRRARRTGVEHIEDREDLAQDAWLKLVKERKPSVDVPLSQRAFTALKQARIEQIRKRNRAKEPPLHALDELNDPVCDDAQMRVFELEESVRAALGDDVLELAQARAARMTEAELANRPGWTAQRAHAASRRLRRHRNDLIVMVLDD